MFTGTSTNSTKSTWRRVALLSALGIASMGAAQSGCASSPSGATGTSEADPSGGSSTSGPSSDATGAIGLSLTLPGGAQISSVTFSLQDGSGNFIPLPNTANPGTIPVNTSLSINFQIGGVPAGSGYALSLSATASNGGICQGSATGVSVTARSTQAVQVQMLCTFSGADAGNLLVKGVPSYCGTWTALSTGVTGSETFVGETLQITAAATGPDPNNLGYTWSVSSSDAGVIGVLGQTQDEAAGPTDTVPFLCTAPGTATITVTIDDGPVADGGVCPSNLTTTSTTVTCDAVPANQVAAAWVEIGSGNATIARAVTAAASCPTIAVNGVSQSMNLRSAAGTVPLRTTASTPALSKPSVFPVQTCEMTLPAGTTSAVVGGKTLPLPKASPQTIVVIGDTGCRMKSSGAQWQACSDPTQWPFQRMANLAASLHPDVVLHVGDYHYRENECPPSLAGCAGSPWGYGWDVWEADLFQPGASLLAAAPWIMVRGNHEQCTRGGQGWYRFLDTKAYNTSNNCDNPANDTQASYSDPYSVALGATSQVIVFDSSNVGSSALSPSNSVFTTYQTELQEAANLATNPNIFNIWTNHHPLLGFTPATGTPPTGGNPALLSVMAATYPGTYYPPNINLALHGHTHLFETIDFASTSLPATIVTGTGGDALDVTLPNPFDLTLQPAAGATVANIADAANFGFLFMQYQPASSTWLITAYRVDGTVRDTCTANLNGQISCTSWGYLN